MKKENMFIQMLEGLHEDEAKVLCLVKDKQLGKRYRITKAVVQEAFPTIQWGNRVEYIEHVLKEKCQVY